MFKFKQGEYVRDLVTGFSGVITSRTDYISGCNRYCVQPPVGEDGKMLDWVAIDEPALERVEKTRLVLEQPEAAPPG